MSNLEKVGLTHFSASQLNKPVANWMFQYVYLTPQQRRKIVVGVAASLGTAAHEAIQNVLCNGQEIDDAIKHALLGYDLHPETGEDEKRAKFKEIMPDIVRQGVDLLAEEFVGSEEEHRIELQLDGVELPIIGYVDLLKEERFVELKTKAPRQGAKKKDGTRGWSKPSLPKEPVWEHVLQAAIYNKATGAEPNIVYVSADNAVAYNPQNCEKLSETYLSYAIDEVRRKCILRQNLLAISDDPKVLASLLEPDFGTFWWDETTIGEAKELWKV